LKRISKTPANLDAETKQLEAAKLKLKAVHRPHAEADSIPERK